MLRIYPERELFSAPTPTPRENHDDEIKRYELDNQVIDEIIEKFRKLYQKRHNVSARISARKQRKAIDDSFQWFMREVYPEHQRLWKELPGKGESTQYVPLYRHRVMVGTGFVDWLYTHHFDDPTPGDLRSEYWWTKYAKATTEEQEDNKSWEDLREEDEKAADDADEWSWDNVKND